MQNQTNTERSGFFREYTRDDVTVSVNVVGHQNDDAWWMEVTSQEGQVTDWDEPFATEMDAWNEFLEVVECEGIAAFL